MPLLVALPAVISAVLLLAVRRAAEPSAGWMLAFVAWYVAGFGLQFFASTPAASTTGLVLLCALGVVLAVRLKTVS